MPSESLKTFICRWMLCNECLNERWLLRNFRLKGFNELHGKQQITFTFALCFVFLVVCLWVRQDEEKSAVHNMYCRLLRIKTWALCLIWKKIVQVRQVETYLLGWMPKNFSPENIFSSLSFSYAQMFRSISWERRWNINLFKAW